MAERNHGDELEVVERVRHADTTLPVSCPPRGLPRAQAAAYVGIKPTLFDEMVKDHRMPSPKRINTRTVWDRLALDEAFAALPSDEDANPWDGGKSA